MYLCSLQSLPPHHGQSGHASWYKCMCLHVAYQLVLASELMFSLGAATKYNTCSDVNKKCTIIFAVYSIIFQHAAGLFPAIQHNSVVGQSMLDLLLSEPSALYIYSSQANRFSRIVSDKNSLDDIRRRNSTRTSLLSISSTVNPSWPSSRSLLLRCQASSVLASARHLML